MRSATVLVALALIGCNTDTAADAEGNFARADANPPRIGTHDADIEAMWDEIDRLRAEVAGSMEKLEARDRTIALRVDDHATDIESIKKDLTEVADAVDVVATEVAGVDQDISRVDGDIDELTVIAMDHGQTLTELQATTGGLATSVGGLYENLAATQGGLASLGEDVVVAAQTSQSAYAAAMEAASQITTHSEAIVTVQANVATLDTAVEAIGSSVAGNASAIDAVSITVADHTVAIDDLAQGGGGSGVTIADTEVHFGVAPTAWTALDLSPVVGQNAAIVVLSLDDPADLTDGRAMFRPGGSDAAYEGNTTASARVRMQGTAFITVATDELGQVEWTSTFPDTDAISVTVVAYAN